MNDNMATLIMADCWRVSTLITWRIWPEKDISLLIPETLPYVGSPLRSTERHWLGTHFRCIIFFICHLRAFMPVFPSTICWSKVATGPWLHLRSCICGWCSLSGLVCFVWCFVWLCLFVWLLACASLCWIVCASSPFWLQVCRVSFCCCFGAWWGLPTTASLLASFCFFPSFQEVRFFFLLARPV